MHSLMKAVPGPAITQLANLKSRDGELIKEQDKTAIDVWNSTSSFMHKNFLNIQI